MVRRASPFLCGPPAEIQPLGAKLPARTWTYGAMRKALASVLLGIVALAPLPACSSGHAVGKDSPPSAAATTSTTTSPQALVLRGYAAAVQAITDAEIRNDPNWSALFQTMVNPELAHVQAFISTEKQLGYHSSGTARVVRSQVTSLSPTRAEVEACVHDEVIAYQANGQPVPGNAGQPTYGVEKGTLIPSGLTWVLQDGTAQQYPSAQQAGS